MRTTLKRTLTAFSIALNVALIVTLAVTFSATEDAVKTQTSEAQTELTRYRAIYDGINVYEDGSWAYKEGVEPYFFWNWTGKWKNAWKIYAETGEDITRNPETGLQVGVKVDE